MLLKDTLVTKWSRECWKQGGRGVGEDGVLNLQSERGGSEGIFGVKYTSTCISEI